jgi:tRNA(Ile)-lysidine synthase
MEQVLAADVLSAIRAHAMWTPGETVLVAVSGGADSMALLYVLREVEVHVEAAYFDHQTRNGESAEDGAFVRQQAAALGVPFHTESRPVEQEAAVAGSSFEAHARAVRYAFLTRVARERGCAAIATGHHADDQAETVLMRLLRGASPQGLAGIPPVRSEAGIRVVRPLIACTRETILAYVEARGIPYRTDRTNADTDFVRNRVRHELLPLLRASYNPRIDDALCRLAEIERAENAYLDAAAHEALSRCVVEDGAMAREPFAELPEALRRRVALLFSWCHGVDCPFDRVDALASFIAAAPTGNRFDLGEGVLLCNSRDVTEAVKACECDARETALPVPSVTEAFGRRFETTARPCPEETDWAANCTPGRQVFDADALGAALSVRHRLPGDRFMPLGMTGSRKLKDYLIDVGVPATRRDGLLLLTVPDGIAWVVGHAMDARFAVTPQTRRIIEVTVTDAS